MSYQSIDELMAELQALKDAGVPGSTPTGVRSVDNNARGGWIKRVEGAARVSVAKSDIDKNHDLCKIVSNRGVEIVVIF